LRNSSIVQKSDISVHGKGISRPISSFTTSDYESQQSNSAKIGSGKSLAHPKDFSISSPSPCLESQPTKIANEIREYKIDENVTSKPILSCKSSDLGLKLPNTSKKSREILNNEKDVSPVVSTTLASATGFKIQSKAAESTKNGEKGHVGRPKISEKILSKIPKIKMIDMYVYIYFIIFFST
jgi:hypothetical protein